ncbi:hypothetical protein [Methanobacterium sp. SMA-27]|uniref:hypothetical protein n=1 Tax=Methanobacterium sp. SMA-27 TaxID=1495336 RepID=UPI00064FAE3A|nr:hypothetical protein [Methanobacterium sp. SMA-27]
MIENIKSEFKRYDICWLINFLKTESCGVNIGICMKKRRIAFIEPSNDYLKPIIVKDVYIDEDNTCEENKFCLNTQCQHNNNTPEQFMKAKNIDYADYPEGWDNLLFNIEKMNQIIEESPIILQEDNLYFELPVIQWQKAENLYN